MAATEIFPSLHKLRLYAGTTGLTLADVPVTLHVHVQSALLLVCDFFYYYLPVPY